MADAPKKPYGDVAYADPGYQKDGKKRYPIDTAEHVKAALSYIGQASNADKYSAGDLAKIKAKIHAAAKKFGIGSDSGQNSLSGPAEKEVAMSVERRYTPGLLTLRNNAEEGAPGTISGYAAVFNKLSRSLGGFVEELNRSVFDRAANDGYNDVICRYNHDDNILLGTIRGGTLALSTDQNGLRYDCVPPNSRADIVELVERGDISQSSFAFRAVEDDWSMTDQSYPKRTLLSVELVDVAPVVTPAYPDTTAGLRSLAQKFDASFDEVRKLAGEDELRKFFKRSDGPTAPVVPAAPKTTHGPSARTLLLARATDPYSDQN